MRKTILITFIAAGIFFVPSASAAFSCDKGTLDGTCNVTTSQDVTGETISGNGELIVKDGGALKTNGGPNTIATLDMNTVKINDKITGNFNITADTLNITQTGQINADAKGYKGGNTEQNGNGPGAGKGFRTVASGAGYGGKGGDSNYGSPEGGNTYPDNTNPAKNPTQLGSGGGGGEDGSGGNGGGKILINTNTATLNGPITANGQKGGYRDGGGGSGGTINIQTQTIKGTPTLQTQGGNGDPDGGAGGGGRIYIKYTNNQTTKINTNTQGGTTTGEGTNGNQGSTYIKNTNTNHLETRNKVNLNNQKLTQTDAITAKNANLYLENAQPNLQNLTIKDSTIHTTNTTLQPSNTRNLTINTNSKLRTDAGPNTVSTLNFTELKLKGTLRGNFNITADTLNITQTGQINADAKGYKGGNTEQNGNGPGAGKGFRTVASGAGYGGKGGDSNYGSPEGGNTYPDNTNPAKNPTQLGSGGGGGEDGSGGNGGGKILINTNTATLNGPITANGQKGGYRDGGGGSGGTINIQTQTIKGTPTLQTQGGNGDPDGGAGGGGRIYIKYTNNQTTKINTNTQGGTTTGEGTNGNQGSYKPFKVNPKPIIRNPKPRNTNLDPNGEVNLEVKVKEPAGENMNISFYNASSDSQIGEELTGKSDGTYSETWTGLSTDEEYSWYANVTDGSNTVKSGVYTFTTIDIKLNWEPGGDLHNGFRIYSNSSGNMTEIAEVGKGTESYTCFNSNLNFGQNTSFEVTAYNSAGESPPLKGHIVPEK
jgi:hypothetical protein